MTRAHAAPDHPAAAASRAEELFERLATDYLGRPGVIAGTGFGGNAGLRLHGRIFAMVVRGRLVVKLPAARATALVGSRAAELFETAPGRVMRQWVTVSTSQESAWSMLIAEAFECASSARLCG